MRALFETVCIESSIKTSVNLGIRDSSNQTNIHRSRGRFWTDSADMYRKVDYGHMEMQSASRTPAVVRRPRRPRHVIGFHNILRSEIDAAVSNRAHSPMTTFDDITSLLQAWEQGDRNALDRAIDLIHTDLKRLARRQMSRERKGHTLQPTALVNEAYQRLVRESRSSWRNRAHFLAVASRVMRRILVDHARRAAAHKRGPAFERVELNSSNEVACFSSPAAFLELHDALKKLGERSQRAATIVELRYFGGLTIEEVSETLGLSRGTVKNDWNAARAYLRRWLEET